MHYITKRNLWHYFQIDFWPSYFSSLQGLQTDYQRFMDYTDGKFHSDYMMKLRRHGMKLAERRLSDVSEYEEKRLKDIKLPTLRPKSVKWFDVSVIPITTLILFDESLYRRWWQQGSNEKKVLNCNSCAKLTRH